MSRRPRTPADHHAAARALGLQRLTEHWFGTKAQAVAEGALRSAQPKTRQQKKARPPKKNRTVIAMPRTARRIGVVLAPVARRIAHEHETVIGEAVKLLRDASRMTLPVTDLARKLRQRADVIREAVSKAGTEAHSEYILIATSGETCVKATPRPYSFREDVSVKEKKAIGARAASLVRGGDLVFIDGGSSTFEAFLAIYARVLSGEIRNIKIVTNSCRVSAHDCDEYLSSKMFSIEQTSGEVRRSTRTTIGESTSADFKRHADLAHEEGRRMVAILGTTFVSVDGCAVGTEMELPTKCELIALTDLVLVLADHTKAGVDGRNFVFASFANWKPDMLIVTDKRPSPEFEKLACVTFEERDGWTDEEKSGNVVRLTVGGFDRTKPS